TWGVRNSDIQIALFGLSGRLRRRSGVSSPHPHTPTHRDVAYRPACEEVGASVSRRMPHLLLCHAAEGQGSGRMDAAGSSPLSVRSRPSSSSEPFPPAVGRDSPIFGAAGVGGSSAASVADALSSLLRGAGLGTLRGAASASRSEAATAVTGGACLRPR